MANLNAARNVDVALRLASDFFLEVFDNRPTAAVNKAIFR